MVNIRPIFGLVRILIAACIRLGDLIKKKYKVTHDKKDYPLCTMCVNVFKRYEELSEDESEHIKSILTER